MARAASDKSETVTRVPLACADETAAVEFLESLRWDDEPSCPRCGDTDVYAMKDRKTGERNARYLWRCRGCSKQFTVRVGTIMEDSPIPLRHWVFVFWAATASKKGVSALQIKRQTGVTYKTALYMMHRVRWAMGESYRLPLDGDVEADETYIGPRRRKGAKPGRSTEHKTPVFAMVQRDGSLRAHPVTNVTGATLKGAIRKNVAPTARMITDEYGAYNKLGDEFAAHDTVSHKWGEYARGDVYTNTAESFFSLLKRGVIGTFHHVSRKHLHRYVSEFEFRWNTRRMDDGARLRELVQSGEGKRLTYAQAKT
jgi:transposase-like protein